MCIGMSVRAREITAPSLLEHLDREENRLPILLIWGKEDRLVPLKIGTRLAMKHPWINLSVIEESGHCPHDESPKEFNKNVLSWLELNLNNNHKTA